MRTMKRCSDSLNKVKLNTVSVIASAYAKEKRYWLNIFQQSDYMSGIKKHREVRDEFVAATYQSPYGLQARMWKLALIEAAETMDKYWQSIFDKVKTAVFNNPNLDKTQRHYCFWLLKDYHRLPSVLAGTVIEFNGIAYTKLRQAVNFLKRTIKRYRKSYPMTKINRSFSLDANCYTCFEHHGKQYIKIMTLMKGERIALPLKGNTVIKGNIRIVLNDKIVNIHHTASLKKPDMIKNDKVIAIDFGYSEVLVDSEGNHYGTDFGSNMTKVSDWLNLKMEKRNKLHALQKKFALSADKAHQMKADNILKNNLGKTKLNTKIERHKSTSLKIINTAFNELMIKTQCGTVVSEALSHPFYFGKIRKMNRRLSSWLRASIRERLSFKALVKGFDHEQVNPAYTSQTCPNCGYVDASNRCSHNKDEFVCQHCKTEGHSDEIAAINLKARYADSDITRYTPYREVKAILLNRFHHRLETKQLGTVSGRIPDTPQDLSTDWGQSESEYQKISNCYI
jgi:putative transposase